MDLQSTIAGFRNLAPLGDLEQAWWWSLNPVLHYTGALTADGTQLLQMNTRGAYSEDLSYAVLSFTREHERELLHNGRFLGFAEGFSAPGHAFDTVAVVAPEVAQLHKVQNPDLTPLTYAVFPAYSCEFSGNETLEEAECRYLKMLPTADIKRDPVPFLKMRFDNPRTGGGSTNPGRALTYERILLQELPHLENAPGGFIEFENRHAKIWRIEWHDGWFIAEEGVGTPREIGLDELLAFATARLGD
ncbi:hypothetical protein [Streptomyces yerevanensis]|uniref:hypothetical protein n=1 Tax=Streptomyces yerevanensis TaxID=66378 RepID=UPI000527EA82|nr:hypothetical protein [Streptomyces yerevanensis]